MKYHLQSQFCVVLPNGVLVARLPSVRALLGFQLLQTKPRCLGLSSGLGSWDCKTSQYSAHAWLKKSRLCAWAAAVGELKGEMLYVYVCKSTQVTFERQTVGKCYR